NSVGLWVPEGAAYVGMITLLMAPLGLLHHPRKHAAFLAALSVAAVATAYGIQPIQWIVGHTPILASLKNARMVFVAAFGLAALAGLGVSALQEFHFTQRRRVLAVAAVIVTFLLVFLLVYKLQLATQFRIEFTRRPSFSRAL